uniref:Retrotransposon gag domain-containing protein n=1 Tax=Fagus sylvatica TaxID=28930 RepID=A0A2N9IHW7_FAGSY
MANSDSIPSAPIDISVYLGDDPTNKYLPASWEKSWCNSSISEYTKHHQPESQTKQPRAPAPTKRRAAWRCEGGSRWVAVGRGGAAWRGLAWIGVGCGVDFWWIPVGVCVVVGRGGLRGGSRWVCEEIASNVIYANTTKEIWEDLRERFAQGNGPRIFEIQKSILVLSQDNSSISSYYTRLKSLWDELSNFRSIPDCSCRAMKVLFDNKQHEYVMQFLMGLNDSFSHVRAQILMTDPLPFITKAFALVVQEERQRNINIPSLAPAVDSVALFTCGEVTRNNYGGKNQSYKKDRPLCSHCGITGDTVDKCYKLHGYPPGYKFKGKMHSTNQSSANVEDPHLPFTQAQCQQLLSMLSSQASLQSSQPPVNNQIVSQESTSSTPHQVASAISKFMSRPGSLEEDWLG